jgi:hypothetical protein
VIAWLMMITGMIGLPISAISLLMIIAGSEGTRHSDPVGFVQVVLGPSIILASGFGLLKRWRIAWVSTVAMIMLTLTVNAWSIINSPRPTMTFTAASGTKTTITGSESDPLSMTTAILCVGLLAKLGSKSIRDEFHMGCSLHDTPMTSASAVPSREEHLTWRVGHQGRDMMYYEEQVNGRWQRIDIDGEMLMGPAHHVIYFKSASAWGAYPEWARTRRAEIITRIKGEFRAPDYAYQNDAV